MKPPKNIQTGTWVQLHFTLFDEEGQPVDASDPDEPLLYLHGFHQVIAGLERGVTGMTAGQTKEWVIPPAQAFGDYDPDGSFVVGKEEFADPSAVQTDDEFELEAADGESVMVRVVECLEDGFAVDANHPLAGLPLRARVHVVNTWPATPEELQNARQTPSGSPPALVSTLLSRLRSGRDQPQLLPPQQLVRKPN